MSNQPQQSATFTGLKAAALELLAQGMTRIETAKELGVNRSTVHRWLQDPGFIRELESIRREQRHEARRSLEALLPDALAVLLQDLTDVNVSRTVRQKAALAVLDRAGFPVKAGVELTGPDGTHPMIASVAVLSADDRAALLRRLSKSKGVQGPPY